jgi:hypothetical protein
MDGGKAMSSRSDQGERGGVQARNRAAMPKTASWVAERRAEYGAAFVNDCLKRAVAGAPDLFYAIEGGTVLGTPFTDAYSPDMVAWQRLAVVTGVEFAAFMARPNGGGVDGTD